ncbi:MAG: quinoprotein relay system zinc metallohydrolase 2 [Gammaproteobacteria bacterium]|nr:quinoprotein relay system zinc metallohydrolase 2 [Gammaproteobacteria bacterium]
MTTHRSYLLLCLALMPAGAPADPGCADSAEVSEIADGVYVRWSHPAVMFENDNIANLGFVIGSRCVAVIDTGGSVAEGRALDCAVRKLTELPVCFVINTHVHPDHVLGNAAFERENVQFIGHEKLPRAMALRGDTYLQRAAEHSGDAADPSQMVMPERTVSGEVQLDLGHRTLIVRAHATAHTDNDLSVFDVRTGTLFPGDLVFLEHLPVLDGSINGWLGELGALMRQDFERVVPGHGPCCAGWPQAGQPTVDYLTDLREKTRAWIARGGELGAAQESIEAARPERWRLIDQYHRRNVSAAFAELEWEE